MCVDPDWGLGLAVVVALYIYRNNRKLQAALTASQEGRHARPCGCLKSATAFWPTTCLT